MTDEIKYVVIKNEDALRYLPEPMLQSLETILNTIVSARAKNGKPPVNEYWICNKDEPYAELVHGIICTGERAKERQKMIRQEEIKALKDILSENKNSEILIARSFLEDIAKYFEVQPKTGE